MEQASASRPCSVQDCERTHYAKSYCKTHYYTEALAARNAARSAGSDLRRGDMPETFGLDRDEAQRVRDEANRSAGALLALAEHMHPDDAAHVRRVVAELDRMRAVAREVLPAAARVDAALSDAVLRDSDPALRADWRALLRYAREVW